MEKSSKLQNIVILRTFAIIAVVLYHCYCPWMSSWNWYYCPMRNLYSFIFETILIGRMPLFVFVSGYLFSYLYISRGKYHTFTGFIENKFKRLLVPCIVFTGVLCACLQVNYLHVFIYGGYHLWFLKMLFLCFMTCWIIAKYVNSLKFEIVLLCVTIAMTFIPFPNVLGIHHYLKYFFFFYGGYLLSKYRHDLNFIFTKKIGFAIIGLYLLLCIITGYVYVVNSHYDIGTIMYTNPILKICRILMRPTMVIVAFIVIGWVERMISKNMTIFCDKINTLSYGIYLFHLLILECIHKYLGFLINPIATEYYILTPPYFVYSHLVIKYLCNKINQEI